MIKRSDPSRLHFVIGGISHETNTYATEAGGCTPLSKFPISRGAEIEQSMRGSKHLVAAYIDASEKHGARISYSMYTEAVPSATICGKAYLQMKTELLDGIRAALPVDGVLLALHGAGISETSDDIEGDLLAAVREIVGPQVPIASAYDLHGLMTEQMRAHCDISLVCRLYPHTDLYDTGIRAVDLLVETVRGTIRPASAIAQVPMLAFLRNTGVGTVASRVNDFCDEISQETGVLDCSWFHGFPYADVAAPSPVVICTTNGDAALAQACADRVAAFIWSLREEFPRAITAPDKGIAAALAAPPGMVVINENSDNPGGGAPGDSTHLLKALIDADLPPGTACFLGISDAAVAAQAHEAGQGRSIQIELGGKCGPRQGAPIQAEAMVVALSNGRTVNKPGSVMEGYAYDLGPSCRLDIGGIDVIVTTRPQQAWDTALAELHGLDVRRYRIVALKGANHFRAGFAPLASAIVSVDSSGLSSADVASFPKTKLTQPLWPLSRQ
jgi:microcystin degradation protein MlrC